MRNRHWSWKEGGCGDGGTFGGWDGVGGGEDAFKG